MKNWNGYIISFLCLRTFGSIFEIVHFRVWNELWNIQQDFNNLVIAAAFAGSSYFEPWTY